MAECVRENKRPFTPGEEGLQDQRLMQAFYESASSGKPIRVEAGEKRDAFRGDEPSQA